MIVVLTSRGFGGKNTALTFKPYHLHMSCSSARAGNPRPPRSPRSQTPARPTHLLSARSQARAFATPDAAVAIRTDDGRRDYSAGVRCPRRLRRHSHSIRPEDLAIVLGAVKAEPMSCGALTAPVRDGGHGRWSGRRKPAARSNQGSGTYRVTRSAAATMQASSDRRLRCGATRTGSRPGQPSGVRTERSR